MPIDEKDASKAISILESHGRKAYKIGVVSAKEGVEIK